LLLGARLLRADKHLLLDAAFANRVFTGKEVVLSAQARRFLATLLLQDHIFLCDTKRC
jgi:hypothetical protein